MKKLFVVLSLATMLMVCLTGSAFADSKTYKGIGSASCTIQTGKDGAMLELTPSSGKLEQTYRRVIGLEENKQETWSVRGVFKVTVNGSTYTVDGRKKIRLSPNTRYSVSVSYACIASVYTIHPVAWYAPVGFPMWKKVPSIKLSVHGKAKIQ